MIKINNLNKSFGNKKGISDFCFDFKSGNIYGLIGPNGAGKTTLIKLITNFLKKDSGEITKNFEKNDMLQNISYAPDFDVFIPGSVQKNINFFNLTYEDTDTELLYKIINNFKIDLTDNVSKLSKGKRKALRFALTISRKVKVYILDEPFSGIDITTRAIFIKLIIKHVDIESSIVIISSHELHDMDNLLDYVLLINDSKLVDSQKVENIKKELNLSLFDWYLENHSDEVII